MSRRPQVYAAACAALLTAACATTAPTPPGPMAVAAAPAPVPTARGPATPIPHPVPAAAPRERIRRAVDLLDRGDASGARAELALLMAEQPGSAVGRSLLDQIDKDPKVLLGARNYPYKVRPGETLSVLAARFLGDPLLFYALARYNGIERPDSNEVGRTLLIPGTQKRAAARPAPATAKAATAAAAAADPSRASSLRRTALEAMNNGGIDRAVALLQQAAPLDPGNSLIRSDLERALRIQANVRNR